MAADLGAFMPQVVHFHGSLLEFLGDLLTLGQDGVERVFFALDLGLGLAPATSAHHTLCGVVLVAEQGLLGAHDRVYGMGVLLSIYWRRPDIHVLTLAREGRGLISEHDSRRLPPCAGDTGTPADRGR